jgi:hypothetical protein
MRGISIQIRLPLPTRAGTLLVVIMILFHIDSFVNSGMSWYVSLCIVEFLVDLPAR